MSYNGSGTFQINTSGQPVVTGTSISSTVFNALTADLATGLSTAITKDGQTTTTARIPFALGINSTLVTDATNTTSGSIITAGGVGIAKALYVGTTANVAGAVTLGGVATFSAQPIFSSLTASSAVATDASKGLVSVTNTGTGNNVLATGPTISGPTISDGTANGVAYLNGSKVLTTGSALVFDGTNLGIKVTPSAWQANNRAIQVSDGYASLSGNSSQGTCDLSYNCYNTTAQAVLGWKYTNSSAAATLYQQLNGVHAWHIAPSGTAGNAITFTQAMTLNANGALALSGASTSANGVGITFPATQSASTDANTLDDYEEGTWTPTDASGAGLTFSTAVGNYTKIGRVVTGSFRVTYPTTVSSAQIIIGGLPFTVNNTEANFCFVGCYSNGTTAISGETATNSTTMYFYVMGTFTASPNSNLSGKTVRGTFTYIV